MATEAPEKQAQSQTGHQAVAAVAADPANASDSTKSAALEWFLDPDPTDITTAKIDINVGGPDGSGTEQWITLTLQVVDRARIRQIRKESEEKQPDGSKEVNDLEANLRIAVEGLLDPNLKDPKNLVVRGEKFLDPADALRARLAHKPGLIDQISGKVIEISGYDDADVREVKAAGN